MRAIFRRVAFGFALLVFAPLLLTDCSFLPGFSLYEEPALYYLPVSEAANQVACELQEFMRQNQFSSTDTRHRWVLSEDDVAVKLTLQTDTSGYVNFTGINVAQIGLGSLEPFILSQTQGSIKVPTLAAKTSAKRTKTVAINFSVSPNTLSVTKAETYNCNLWRQSQNPLTRLYLTDWLNNYFDTINYKEGSDELPEHPSFTERVTNAARKIVPPQRVPSQLKIQSVNLTTTILVAIDISAGASPNVLGNGSVFILPINGLGADYNPDYSHKLDITINICDNNPIVSAGKKPVYPCHHEDNIAVPITDLMREQCMIYARLRPLLTGVKAPQDAEEGGVHKKCDPASGKYVKA